MSELIAKARKEHKNLMVKNHGEQIPVIVRSTINKYGTISNHLGVQFWTPDLIQIGSSFNSDATLSVMIDTLDPNHSLRRRPRPGDAIRISSSPSAAVNRILKNQGNAAMLKKAVGTLTGHREDAILRVSYSFLVEEAGNYHPSYNSWDVKRDDLKMTGNIVQLEYIRHSPDFEPVKHVTMVPLWEL